MTRRARFGSPARLCSKDGPLKRRARRTSANPAEDVPVVGADVVATAVGVAAVIVVGIAEAATGADAIEDNRG